MLAAARRTTPSVAAAACRGCAHRTHASVAAASAVQVEVVCWGSDASSHRNHTHSSSTAARWQLPLQRQRQRQRRYASCLSTVVGSSRHQPRLWRQAARSVSTSSAAGVPDGHTPSTPARGRRFATETATSTDKDGDPRSRSTSSGILSDITVYSKYARYLPSESRREVWSEIVERNKTMHLQKFPDLHDDIISAYELVHNKLVLPSMRSLQFAGGAVAVNNVRMFNCSFLPITTTSAFSELMFLLLSGTGAGFSVQQQHISQLPRVRQPHRGTVATHAHVHNIDDSIEGWADAARVLLDTYLPDDGVPRVPVKFDYSAIRPKGSPIITAGGRAPGPEPLREALEASEAILARAADNTRLSPLDVHDIVCHLATCVASGGVRRSALISLFSPEDAGMAAAKSGEWWERNSQRAMANNSAVLDRAHVTEAQFMELWQHVRASNSGEPGIYLTNSTEWGTNPCCEIALEPFQFCNLTEMNVSAVSSQQELDTLARCAAFIGTLQASYTDFHYLRPEWAETTRRSSLLGVGMTGIASGAVMRLDLSRAAHAAVDENARVSAAIGISTADRVTTVKPAGTTSLVLGTSSGVHPWHAEHYIRRMRVNKQESLYPYLLERCPALIEDDVMSTNTTAVVSFPQRAPPGATLRSESALHLLDRVHRLHDTWIRGGHRRGVNTNNVSTTVSVREHEWDGVGAWMWHNRDAYNGLCVLPYSGHTYKQAPFEECSKATYDELMTHITAIDLREVKEDQDGTSLQLTLACAGPDSCEL
ncbi:ribonucleoside-triphosphate reductase [Salpingoeca rosetta]|uniref:Ribonucleoside-triphosphate reductase n=1 Tax=Salpingoeca rosetta (strain ATCC 50818 / BSB-021) TaxID=946362 RepID=F2U650_SALR5|nr:ribonucleoside-triphosphate reductase [Salpingoeca rosetta]EGD82991.1 ribonucleoside-triphosphate reductase [Salpingoeca rosetta]|eukprot:XP_004995355.1 ribonucleoside-triphosphate reductase [Salpingoeca rosetta]